MDKIFIDVNVLEKLTSQWGLTDKDLEKWHREYKKERKLAHPRLDALKLVKQYSKLMLLGQPGAGKTTFLKHLAILAATNKMDPKSFPV